MKGYVIMHSPFHFSSDSDAAFRRDRLRMVLRPCITGHKFRLYPGFRRARPLQRSVSASVLPFLTVMTGRAEKARASPCKSHTGDKNYAAHSCSCRGFRVGSPPETFDHSPFEYNGRLLRTMSHESRFFRHGFSSDSDAAFRRDRLRMVLRPCITGHKFRLYPGFRRARHARAPTNRIQAIKIMQLIAAVVGASAWEARQRHLTTAHSSIMAGCYEP